nr:MAG TPA: hypothetical protein [Caudoviricetes sp.]
MFCVPIYVPILVDLHRFTKRYVKIGTNFKNCFTRNIQCLCRHFKMTCETQKLSWIIIIILNQSNLSPKT